MLMPKRTKWRKQMRGKIRGEATRGNEVSFGEFGLQSLEPAWLSARVIEAGRVAASRSAPEAKLWIRVFPHKSVSKKAAETRMGTGKGDVEFWAYFWIGFVRLGVAFVVCHLIGRAYGRTVLIWFGKYLGVRAEQIHKIMDMFHHAEWFVIPFFVGSNIVAAISGIARVSAGRLAVLL